MTKRYYRPLVGWGHDRPAAALDLAGGWCWFHQVVVTDRLGGAETIAACDVPAEVKERLTSPRAAIAGLSTQYPVVMGILNVTPDSFSDGGQFNAPDLAVAHAAAMVGAGAAILDIGGESTRPGAATVDVALEIDRTAPVVAAIRAQLDVPMSIDTRKGVVAKAAVAAGAGLINDVAAMTFDPTIADVAAQADLPICLMHAQGDPETMQMDPQYDDVLCDVYDFLEDRITVAMAAGIARDRIVIDPGIGFGKTLAHNLALLRGIAIFHTLGCQILLGASRKRFIGTLGGGASAADRMAGSVAVALHGARQGVQFLRVHDTFETKQALDLEWAINGAEQA